MTDPGLLNPGETPRDIADFGAVRVQCGPDWTCTHDARTGRTVFGAPEPTPAYALLARQIGYGADTARMCVDHELMHSALAHLLGLPASPTLTRVAVDPAAPATDLTRLEEMAVLAVQAYALQAGVDLVTLFCRGGETT